MFTLFRFQFISLHGTDASDNLKDCGHRKSRDGCGMGGGVGKTSGEVVGGLGFMLVQALRAIIKRSLTQLNELCRGKNEC